MRHAEGLRCLHRMETTTTTIYSVFRLGFAVFKQDIKRYRRVGALLLNSLCNDVTTFLKFWTDFTDLIPHNGIEIIRANGSYFTSKNLSYNINNCLFGGLVFFHALNCKRCVNPSH